ncbi:hypothetical protein [Pseudonocardia endophytica]|uniref:Uncharacterized protein n=1 Tax=Pseudonocardia endophytica TaxID=401976 RepID=A0A4R1I242_PSEEN|nr:hypothetical protein [Pseudonocardia endophytica]TCK26549.1 hypothetical protein EV378_2386 [Pseudonocardia endophytica]
MPGLEGASWTWPDAVLAALLAVCLALTSALLVTRFVAERRRTTAIAPAVGAALVVAMAVTMLTRDEASARAVVIAAVALVVAVSAVTSRRSVRSDPPERERHEVHNEIAPPDHRC